MSSSSSGGPRAWHTLAALGGARLRRLLSQARSVFTEDPGEAPRARADLAGAQALYRSAGELKGGAAKVAQLMAYLEDPEEALAGEARDVLARLFDHVPGADPAGIRQVLIEDLGAPPEDLFAVWEERPFAAASLGEVHGATGRDGADLAVKVQYPGVAAALAADLASAAVVRRLGGAALGSLPGAALDRIRAAVAGETDYAAEAAALRRFRRALAGDNALVVPRVHDALSSGRVLTMDRLRGQPPAAFAGSAPPAARAAVAAALFRYGHGAPLVHGLLNADPNPGNFLVMEGERVGLLDFGCCAELGEDTVTCERVLWQSVLAEDGETLRYALYREGLVQDLGALDSTRYRAWEQCLAAPFRTHRFAWTPGYARELAAATSVLVRDDRRRFTLPPAAVLLWRQRLGLAVVIGQLGAEADFRQTLLDLLRAVDMAPAGVR